MCHFSDRDLELAFSQKRRLGHNETCPPLVARVVPGNQACKLELETPTQINQLRAEKTGVAGFLSRSIGMSSHLIVVIGNAQCCSLASSCDETRCHHAVFLALLPAALTRKQFNALG
jgi:hypothetical protein